MYIVAAPEAFLLVNCPVFSFRLALVWLQNAAINCPFSRGHNSEGQA